MSSFAGAGGLMFQPFAPLSLNTAGQTRSSPLARPYKMPGDSAQHVRPCADTRIDQENAWNPALGEVRTRAALPRAMQLPRQRREDLNPLRRSDGARRTQQRDAFLNRNRQHRDDAVWNVRADQIQQRDSLDEWRRFREERAREAPLSDAGAEQDFEAFEVEEDVPAEIEQQLSQPVSPPSLPSDRMDTSSSLPYANTPSVYSTDVRLHSQGSERNIAAAPRLQSSMPSDSSGRQSQWSNLGISSEALEEPQAQPSSPMTRYWSDDEDFEQALWDAFDGDEMDMS